jgi:hypothetical protein
MATTPVGPVRGAAPLAAASDADGYRMSGVSQRCRTRTYFCGG